MTSAAWAQGADENVLNVAEDAFGTKVGNDNVGLYGPTSARGFNPQLAGNARIEGLYFDQQGFMGRAIARSTTMRVGLSAQSYPFAAPTGIADISLPMPVEKRIVGSASYDISRPTGVNSSFVSFSTPITDELGWIAIAVPYSAPRTQGESHGTRWNFATFGRWRPTESIEAIPFFFIQKEENEEVSPSIYTAGSFAPPHFDRRQFYGQEWADRAQDDVNYGLLLRARPFDNWVLRGGIFGSEIDRSTNYVVSYRNVQPDGVGTLSVLKYPSHRSLSYSGEVRATGVYTQGKFRHTINLAIRGRDTERTFGGGMTLNFGQHQIGVYDELPKPRYTYGIRDKDIAKQLTPGISYGGEWAGVGEFSVGMQKSYYDRSTGKLGGARSSTQSEPWLYNATVAYHVSSKLIAYGSYARGMEEFGTAPDGTFNAGEPLQARVGTQIDAGIRYTVIPGLNLMLGAFQISKPYYDRDAANLYTVVGNLKHKGFEFSLTGKPISSVTVVAGAVYIKGRVSGLPVDNGTIGATEPGLAPYTVRLNVQYSAPSWKGASMEFQANSETKQYANRTNTFKVPTLTTFAIGGRYPFKIGSTRITLRALVDNIFNAYAWQVDGNSGRFSPSSVRTFQGRISADF